MTFVLFSTTVSLEILESPERFEKFVKLIELNCKIAGFCQITINPFCLNAKKEKVSLHYFRGTSGIYFIFGNNHRYFNFQDIETSLKAYKKALSNAGYS